MVTTNGTGQISYRGFVQVCSHLLLLEVDCLNGGPTLSITPENMYWKHDTRKSVVFSELTMFDFSRFNCGGTNLRRLEEESNAKTMNHTRVRFVQLQNQ
jgi:hypothetical protein